MHISWESNLEDDSFTCNALATSLTLPPPLPLDDYKCMALEYRTEHPYNITMIEKINKFVTITPVIQKRVENLVVKSALTFTG